MAVQVTGEVLSTRAVGAYQHVTLVAPGVAEQARPGQFVALRVGGPTSALILRRSFALYSARARGVYGGTVEIVVASAGAGSAWVAGLAPHDPVDIVGPLGRPFSLPRDPVTALLVGGGYGSAPLFLLHEALRERGCTVDMLLGASTGDRIFGSLEAKRMSRTATFTTDDASFGEPGRVSDVLGGLLERSGTDVVYACGPMAMLAAVSRIGAEHGVPVQVAVEESMACGIGVCMTCVLPVVGDDGVTRMVRACVEGPVFFGEKVRFDDLGTVPADALGAPAGPR